MNCFYCVWFQNYYRWPFIIQHREKKNHCPQQRMIWIINIHTHTQHSMQCWSKLVLYMYIYILQKIYTHTRFCVITWKMLIFFSFHKSNTVFNHVHSIKPPSDQLYTNPFSFFMHNKWPISALHKQWTSLWHCWEAWSGDW